MWANRWCPVVAASLTVDGALPSSRKLQDRCLGRSARSGGGCFATARRWLGGGGDKNGTTYYDSQSGRHVPIHDEGRVTAYLRVKNNDPERAVSDARALGMAGAMLTLPRKDGVIGLAELLESWSLKDDETRKGGEEFEAFLRVPPPHQSSLPREPIELPRLANDVNLCFEYMGQGCTLATDIEAAASDPGRAGRTSLGVFDPSHYDDPVSIASGVAGVIDASDATGGVVSHILLIPGEGGGANQDGLFELCEELCYLDVPGPTIKSRLVVHAAGEDVLAEILGMGINKYLVDDDEDGVGLDMLIESVREQGKDIYLGGRPV
mmetsp:Transcript_54020/g.114736  ORF Transcript_54020/g.114736 Transcript_54020/m.114736 type:complete len:322 (-) Transcript_54020:485-1450(-)